MQISQRVKKRGKVRRLVNDCNNCYGFSASAEVQEEAQLLFFESKSSAESSYKDK